MGPCWCSLPQPASAASQRHAQLKLRGLNLKARTVAYVKDLEDDRWPAPSGDATRLVATAHALRRKPIGELTVEDMRLLIRQNEGLPYLLPLALEVLQLDPMAEGHMYEGDLLAAVLTRSPEIWSKSPELGRELRLIVSDLSDLTPNLKHEVERFLAL
ncbi:contact-dependent growth inhibition system immunity protein [Streptomyces atratus]|uniref:contact-dependent growth inhibition system immunity protein n=1 Tax=Streptomyces atratus TaxID=1893 RepID=UPI00227D7D7B|nr:contact-dependent growth inhibition system immunity protein [Streptomyces atratus]WPW33758.1 contact-dependent growth inhibition system immunity protein [Streptomyces atratus]